MKEEITADDLVVAWNAATQQEREQFCIELLQKYGKEELYLILIDAAGGEEEFKKIVAESLWRSNLS